VCVRHGAVRVIDIPSPPTFVVSSIGKAMPCFCRWRAAARPIGPAPMTAYMGVSSVVLFCFWLLDPVEAASEVSRHWRIAGADTLRSHPWGSSMTSHVHRRSPQAIREQRLIELCNQSRFPAILFVLAFPPTSARFMILVVERLRAVIAPRDRTAISGH